MNLTVHTPLAAGSRARLCEPVGDEMVTRASATVEHECRSVTFAGVERCMESLDDVVVIIDAPETTP